MTVCRSFLSLSRRSSDELQKAEKPLFENSRLKRNTYNLDNIRKSLGLNFIASSSEKYLSKYVLYPCIITNLRTGSLDLELKLIFFNFSSAVFFETLTSAFAIISSLRFELLVR